MSSADLIRVARLSDVARLNALIAESAEALSRGYYTPEETASLTRYVFGVDTQLLADRSYYVVERGGEFVACGGWSARRTLFGGDQTKQGADPLLNSTTEAARIRAFFVHPSAARQGLGRLLLEHCEAAAAAAGFRRLTLMATLPGEPFYRGLGYEPLEAVQHPLPDGTTVRFLRMGRALG